jgi:hypothetical protein
MRVLGFLVGAALIAALAFAFGLHPLKMFPHGTAGSPAAPEGTPLPASAGTDTGAPGPAEAPPTIPAEAPDGAPEASPESVQAGAGPAAEAAGQKADAPHEAYADVAGAEARPPAESDSQYWEAFFTPFRSRASADGFARFLQTATGRDFRVTKAAPGEYRVWVRVDPAGSSADRIAEIEAATGMPIRGGQL